MARETRPLELLSVGDGIFLTVGMIIGALIFKAPSMVAGATSGPLAFLFAWLLGGAISLCGALVYAELASRHPHTGGEYVFLNEGMGRGVAFLFAWSRMTVIQTGAIAAVAFVFGDYASEIFSFGAHSSAIWAAGATVVLTVLNLIGTLQTKALQKVMETTLITGMVIFSIAAIVIGGADKPAAAGSGSGSFGFAMIFVLLAYGGWNEAAYLAGEVRNARRNMTRILVWGVIAVTVLYLVVNLGYLAVLGHGGIRDSKAVAADVMRVIAGEKGAVVLALIVCISVLTTMNAAIFTGARTSWAFGRDFRMLRFLGDWRETGSTPANALILQGAITLLLVAAGAATPDGFNAMVAYTTPVFWTFMYLVATSFFMLRDSKEKAPFSTPFYPHIPFVFCIACLYMLWSSIDYVRNPDYGPKFGWAVGAGLVVMAAGIPLYFTSRR
ncbi:MAG: APC family permease [Betaproteobacteria bacterium]|nr:APC family permease [Betaproteobacteria bacterium]MBV9361755.1 APC family permease [Betaproteobacteria bacterium]